MKMVIIIVSCFFTFKTMAQLETVTQGVYTWASLLVKTDADKEYRKILEGESDHLSYLEIHATTQFKGAKPSTAHANDDVEECIIIKEGKLQATIEGRSVILGPGGVILLLPKQVHSLENIGDGNLTYYVIRYRSKKKMDLERGQAAGGTITLNKDSLKFIPSAKGGGRPYFDRATAMCERFEMHTTELDKIGESHAPHKHTETEIILMISGDTEMVIDGKKYNGTTGDLFLMPAESFHGIRNSKDKPCSYFAFKWK